MTTCSVEVVSEAHKLEMTWAAKRPTNEPLTGLFTGPLTTGSVFVYFWAANEPLTLFENPLSVINVIKSS